MVRARLAEAEAAVDRESRASAISALGRNLAKIPVHADATVRLAGGAGEVLAGDQGPGTPVPAPPAGAVPAAPGPAVPAAPGPAACAHPVNWTHTTASDNGPDGIQIPITWGSSTGTLADLSNCTVREVVRYDPIPNPPFTWNPPNPTILTVPGVNGAGQDTHSYPPGLAGGLVRPLVEGTMTAHQEYQYQCTGPGCAPGWTGFPGQTYDLIREVFAAYVYTDPWRYRITKRGTGNMFSYSREVPIP
jgi:hypothetical protein